MKIKPSDFNLSLRIWGGTVHPNVICASLGLTASVAVVKGERKLTPKGVLLDGRYRENYCCFDLPRRKREYLDEALMRNCEIFSQSQPLFKRIRETGGRPAFFINWHNKSNNGEVFSAELISSLAVLGFDLMIDVYNTNVLK